MVRVKVIPRQRPVWQSASLFAAIALQIGLWSVSYSKIRETYALFRPTGTYRGASIWAGSEILICATLLVVMQIVSWRYKILWRWK
jgi:hypothetical protein